MTQRLIIVGNGFDLYHHMPTHYSDFRQFLVERNSDLVQTVETYLPSIDGRHNNDWANLEAALADIDVDNVISDCEMHLPSYSDEDWSDAGHHSFQYAIEEIVSDISAKLRSQFEQWASEIAVPRLGDFRGELLIFSDHDRFLSFNYTGTLEDLYQIPSERVFHIHGYVGRLSDGLVLGHGWAPDTRQSLNEGRDLAEQDTRVTEAFDIVDDYFGSTFKPTQRILDEHAAYFASMCDVEEVVILGHSLSEVDHPYFLALLSNLPGSAVWRLACRDEESKLWLTKQLLSLEVSPSRIFTSSWPEVL
jgi:hypothetical protein